MNVISDQEFRDFGTTSGELDQALTVHYPEWANYTQMFPLSTQPVTLGEIVQWASLDEEANLQINPAVTLVTLGDSLDWQLPSNTDLYLKSQEISTELNRLSFDWENPFDDSLRRQYPDVANSGTYALYAFFDYDLDRLQTWQQTYRGLFGEDLLQATSADAGLLEATDIEPFLTLPFEHPETKFWTVNSFFDHQSPLYDEDASADTLYRFDGKLIQRDVANGIYVGRNDCSQTLTGATCYSGHDGIDYNLDEGEPVLAAAAGTVINADKIDGTVIIQHANGLVTTYLHMSAVYVDSQDPTKNTVSQGDVIGEAGDKGDALGVHLHFGVRQPDNVWKDIDPFGWWSLDPDPWSTYPTYGQTSTWLWKGDEVGDGYLTVDNRESQAQFFLPPSSAPPVAPEIGWHRLTSGYDGEAWYSFMHNATDDLHKYWAIWGSTIEQPGEYIVQAYWPDDPDPSDEWQPSSNARYTLYYHQNGVLQEIFLYGNQTVGGNQFNPLCKVELTGGNCPADQIAQFTFGQGATSLILSNPSLYDTSQHRRILFYDAVQWQPYTPPTPTPVATNTPIATITPISPPPTTNYALRFQLPTSSQAILMPSATNLNFGGDMTIEFWIKTTSTYGGSAWHDAQWILDKDIGGAGRTDWAVVLRSGKIVFNNGTGACCSDHALYSVGSVNNGAWHHVAIARNVSTGNGLTTIYIDGNQDTSGYFSMGNLSNTLALRVGVENGIGGVNNRTFRGDLDDLRLWNVARNQSDIQENRHTRLQGTESGLVGYWRFDEGAGQVVNDLAPFRINAQLGSSASNNTGDPEWISAPELFGSTPPTPIPTSTGPTSTPLPTPIPCSCPLDDLSNGCVFTSSNTEPEPIFHTVNYIQQALFDIQLFHRVEDEVLSQTPQGQHYIDLYYGHGIEITNILRSNSALRDEAIATLQLWEPNLQALVDGNGNASSITSGQVQAIQTFLDHLYAAGSPALRQMIDSERANTPLEGANGMTMDQAWTYLNGFPSTPILDDFNRANGAIGSNWSGNPSKYTINANHLKVISNDSNSDIYWNAELFGADQEAYITFSDVSATATEHDLLLKSQSNTTWGDGVLEVLYDAPNQRAQVWTYEWPAGWVQHGADIPVTFVDGDQFGARAYADGTVEVYKNGTLLATRDITSWSHYAGGGYIGLWFIGAQNTKLDDFGGGTLSGGQQPMLAGSSAARSLTSDQLKVTVNTATQFWQGVPLGQTASVTFTNLQSNLKPQSNGVWGEGTIQVLYDVPNQRVQVWMYDSTKSWTQIGKDIPVKFTAGDTFTVRVLSDGTLEISRNGKVLARRKVNT